MRKILLFFPDTPHLTNEFNCPPNVNTYYPHPNTCDEYYICADGLSFKFKCSPPLRWNADNHFCDWPENVRCNREQSPSNAISHNSPNPQIAWTRRSTTTTTTTTTTPAPPPPTPPRWNPPPPVIQPWKPNEVPSNGGQRRIVDIPPQFIHHLQSQQEHQTQRTQPPRRQPPPTPPTRPTTQRRPRPTTAPPAVYPPQSPQWEDWSRWLTDFWRALTTSMSGPNGDLISKSSRIIPRI